MKRIFTAFLALLSLAAALPAHAADLKELRTMLGVTIGKFDVRVPPATMTSMPSGLPCHCPDFCRVDIPGAGVGTSISVRWTSRGAFCGADLMTVQATTGSLTGVDAPNLVSLYGMSPDEITARYGKPSGTISIAQGQFIYCDLLDDAPGAPLTGELIYYGFQFSNGRLTAIRVSSGPTCPDYPFVPTP